MSEQIREQVSAFLDGELPNPETELLLKRLTRDGELRESFGRYALIGEAIRGNSRGLVTKHFAGRVNLAIDGEPVAASGQIRESRAAKTVSMPSAAFCVTTTSAGDVLRCCMPDERTPAIPNVPTVRIPSAGRNAQTR